MLRQLYCYVDYNHSHDGINSVWQRVHVNEIAKIIERYPKDNLFTSIQSYKNDKHEDGELQFTPIYFDLDYKDDVEVALMDARSLVDYFSRMDVGKEHLRVWFSGSKGFHITISPELFGIKPHEELTYIIKNACIYTATHLNLKSFDTRVYSIRRLWRLPDTIHQKTGLYCVELSHQELQNLSLFDIKKLAVRWRDSLFDDEEYEHIDKNPICESWFSVFIQQYQTQKDLQNLRPKTTITAFKGEDPVCIKDLLANSLRKSGTRNQGEMALVSYYKDTGVEEKVAQEVVTAWVKQIPKGMTSMTDKRSLEADVKGVVRTVYDEERGDNYHFACHFIRALGTGTNKPIACTYDKCKFVNQEDQEPEKPIELKLPEASRAVYIGKRVRTAVMIAGRDDIPFGIPSHISVECKPDLTRDNSICKVCAISAFGGLYDLKFGAKDEKLLSLIDTSDVQQKQFIRKKCGIPERCPKHKIKVLEYANVVEVMLIPRVDFRPDTITEDEPYVFRRGYYVGHDIEANKEYAIMAYTFPDPKSQHLVHVIEEAVPLSDDIALFKPDPVTLEMLKKFQVEM